MWKENSFWRLELIAVVLTGFLKPIMMDWLMLRGFYISGICIFWFSYVFYRYTSKQEILQYWGFRRDNFKDSFLFLLPLIFLSILISILYGHFNNSLSLFTWHVLPILVLYPVWGVIQQYLMLGLLSHNLILLLEVKINRYTLVFLISALFGIVHYPNYFLMIFTFVMEAVFIIVYLKWRNLWAIGIAHGLIATFLLYFVLKRDLWSELFI